MKKKLTKISVKVLCQLAESNRSTFYYQYLDVHDLADKAFQQANNELMGKFRKLGANTPFSKNSFYSFFTFVKENREIFKLSNDSRHTFPIEEGLEDIKEILRSAYMEDLSESLLINHIVFFQAGFTFLLRNWLEADCSTSIDDLVDTVQAYLPKKIRLANN